MPEAAHGDSHRDVRIMLDLLESVERDGRQTQRKLAAELDIALGLVNAYLRRCVNKGYLKMKAVPTRRYVYYLTPKGFAEKSRLTVDYFSSSFSFFRRARADCSTTLKLAAARGSRKLALLGVSDLAEIAVICAMETDMTVVAIVEPGSSKTRYVGIPVVSSLEAIREQIDAAIVTNLKTTQVVVEEAIKNLGPELVLVPELLGARIAPKGRISR